MELPAETADGALRDTVLTGRYFGPKGKPGPLAQFLSGPNGLCGLRDWFGEEWLSTIPRGVEGGAMIRGALSLDIAALDALLSAQLAAILQATQFRRLEGAWRGLSWLVARPAPSGRVRIRVLHARWAEICRDLERAIEFDQSELFRKIYEDEFGTAGGEPFGLLAADYELRHRPTSDHPTDDISALGALAGVAAAAFAPILLAAAPEFFGLDSFAEAPASLDFAAAVSGSDHHRWRRLRDREDLRFVGLALPRMLARAAWRDDGARADGFRFRADPGGAAQRVWCSPVYAFAAVAVRAFEQNGWPAQVRGAEIGEEASGGVVDGSPCQLFPADILNEPPMRTQLELALTDDQERQVADAGFVPLAALEFSSEAAFGLLPSTHRPPRMTGLVANANQRLSTQINTLLCVSRFAHYIKLMGRDMIGSALAAEDVQMRLQRWIDSYVSGIGSGGPEVTARYPLQEAKIEVREQPRRPGSLNCVVYLRPHHQLDEIGSSFRFVTEFAGQGAAAAASEAR